MSSVTEYLGVTVDLSSGNKVSPCCGDIFRGHQMRDQKGREGRFDHLTANISKTVSQSVTCKLSLTSARRALSKNVSHGAVSLRGVHYNQNMLHFLALFAISIVTDARPLMRGRAALVYEASRVATIGRIPIEC